MKIAGGAVLGPLRQVFSGESVSGLGEGDLLDRFLHARDEPAFSALVARLGPMVLGVCRRTLSDPRDVEDAFQATFLILVRRGATLRDRDHLAPWLFGVARRVATRARADSARRRSREGSLPGDPVAEPGRDDHRVELARALVEEIDHLPGTLRGPVVLCCGEGLSYEEAAGRLHCTVPAVRGRLARARDRLRTRLVRRGFAPTAGTLAAWAGPEGASAVVPSALIEVTTRSALACAAGTLATAGGFPAAVVVLAEGATRTMILTKWKFLAAGVTTLGIASGVGVLAQQPAPSEPGPGPGAAALKPTERSVTRIVEVTTPGPDGRPVSTLQPVTVVETVTEPAPGDGPLAEAFPVPETEPADRRRLDALESKLDRVLGALEAAKQPKPARRASSNASGSRADRAPRAELAQPDIDDEPAPSTVSQPAPPVLPPKESSATPSRKPRSYGFSNTDAKPNPATIVSRIDGIERKLSRLEARFAAMERNLGIYSTEAADTAPNTTQPEGPPADNEPFLVPTPDTRIYQPAPTPTVDVPAPRTPDVRPLENYKPRPQ